MGHNQNETGIIVCGIPLANAVTVVTGMGISTLTSYFQVLC